MKTAKINDKLFYEICPGFVVPVIVNEVNDVYSLSENKQKEFGLTHSTLWANKTDEDEGYFKVTGYEKTTEDNPWGFKKLPVEILEHAKHVNHFVWIDEVVGHAVQLDDEVFEKLDDALAHARTINKKQAYRRHKKVQAARGRSTGFIRSTQGGEPNCPLITERKKIYVNIGHKHKRW